MNKFKFFLVISMALSIQPSCSGSKKNADQPVEETKEKKSIVLEKIIVSPEHVILQIHKEQQFRARGIYSDGTTHDITFKVKWTSETPNIASVDRKGLAKGLSEGEAHLKVSFDDKSAYIFLTVGKATEGVPKKRASFHFKSIDLDAKDGDEFILEDSWVVKILSGAKELMTHLLIKKNSDEFYILAKRTSTKTISRGAPIDEEIARTKEAQGPGVIKFLGQTKDHNGNGALLVEKLEKEFGDIDYSLAHFLSLLKTLDRLHKKGIIHTDIKPNNIMTNKNGEVLYIDFTKTTIGTPGYSDKKVGTVQGDIYSLGLTVFESKYKRHLENPHYSCHPLVPDYSINDLMSDRKVDNSAKKPSLVGYVCRYIEKYLTELKKTNESLSRQELLDKLLEKEAELKYAPLSEHYIKNSTEKQLLAWLLSALINIESKNKNRDFREEAVLSLLKADDSVDKILKKMIQFQYLSVSEILKEFSH